MAEFRTETAQTQEILFFRGQSTFVQGRASYEATRACITKDTPKGE